MTTQEYVPMMQHVAMDSRVKRTRICKKRILRYARLMKFLEDSVSVVALERTVKTAKKQSNMFPEPRVE